MNSEHILATLIKIHLVPIKFKFGLELMGIEKHII